MVEASRLNLLKSSVLYVLAHSFILGVPFQLLFNNLDCLVRA